MSKLFFPFNETNEISLDDFEQKSRSLANSFQEKIKGEPIAFIGDKSLDHCLHLNAAHIAGNPFFHFNPQYPVKKWAELVDLLNLKNIFCDSTLFDKFDELKRLRPQVKKIQFKTSASALEIVPASPIAYYMATSGSTGTPKIIEISREQLECALSNIERLIEINNDDLFSHVSQLCFDVAIADFFIPLRQRCSLLFIPSTQVFSSLSLIEKYKATVWSSSPSLLKFCFNAAPDTKIPSIKKAIHCGEAFDQTLSQIWNLLSPGAELINLYGPAEATIAVSGHRCPNPLTELPIGEAFNKHVFKVTAEGELLIKGPQVVEKYFNGAGIIDENQFYATGDFFDSEMKFRGRRDDQIKIAGMRFNLAAIEKILYDKFNLTAAVQLINEEMVVVVSEKNIHKINLKELQSCLKDELPVKFIPKKLFIIKELPLSASGKLDRKSILALLK